MTLEEAYISIYEGDKLSALKNFSRQNRLKHWDIVSMDKKGWSGEELGSIEGPTFIDACQNALDKGDTFGFDLGEWGGDGSEGEEMSLWLTSMTDRRSFDGLNYYYYIFGPGFIEPGDLEPHEMKRLAAALSL